MQSTKRPRGPRKNITGHATGAPAPGDGLARAGQAKPPGWHTLTDEMQLVLAREAMIRAAATLADQAELLGLEMEAGTLRDRGGPDALRLFAAIIRATNADVMGPVGHA
jgi:hypothetical protein